MKLGVWGIGFALSLGRRVGKLTTNLKKISKTVSKLYQGRFETFGPKEKSDLRDEVGFPKSLPESIF